MEFVSIEVISSTVVIIVLLWAVISVRHLKRLKKEVMDQWEMIWLGLSKRADYVPLFVETVRNYDKNQEKIIEELIAKRLLAAKEKFPTEKKIVYEYDLTEMINKLTGLGEGNKELFTDTTYLELKKEIADLEQNIDEKTRKYNEMVRYYNSHCRMVILKPMAMIFGYEPMNIFEMEI